MSFWKDFISRMKKTVGTSDGEIEHSLRSRKPSVLIRQRLVEEISDTDNGSGASGDSRTEKKVYERSRTTGNTSAAIRKTANNFLESFIEKFGNGEIMKHDSTTELRFIYENYPARITLKECGKEVTIEIKLPVDDAFINLVHEPGHPILPAELPLGCDKVHSGLFLGGRRDEMERTRTFLQQVPESYRKRLYDFMLAERVGSIFITDTFSLSFRESVDWKAVRGWRERILRTLRFMSESAEIFISLHKVRVDGERREHDGNSGAAQGIHEAMILCPHCGTEVVATPDGRCPECGTAIPYDV